MVPCMHKKARYNIKVIELALGAPGIVPGNDPQLQNLIAMAQRDGFNIVAAAGNTPGPLEAPANHPGVLSVGGIDQQGQLWRAPDGIGGSANPADIVTLSTGLDLAFPDGRPARGQGTSEASAFVAAVLTALRSYRPDLTADQAEQILTNTAKPTMGGPALNVEAVFYAAGLPQQWEQAARHVPPPPTLSVTSCTP